MVILADHYFELTLINPSFSVTKILSSETAIARGLSRFSAKIVTKSFLEFKVGSGKGIGSDGEVRTKAENTTAPTIAAICIFLSTKR